MSLLLRQLTFIGGIVMAADPQKALDRINTAQASLLGLHELRSLAGSNRSDYLERLERLEGYLRDAEDSIGTESESYQFQRSFAHLDEARKALDNLAPLNPQEEQLVDSLYSRLAQTKSEIYHALEALGFALKRCSSLDKEVPKAPRNKLVPLHGYATDPGAHPLRARSA